MVALAPASLPMNPPSMYRGTSPTPLAVPPSLPLHQISRTSPFTGRRITIALLASPLLLFYNINNHTTRAMEEEEKNESQQDEERVVRIFQDASPSVAFIKDIELQPRSRRKEEPNPLASPLEDDDDSGKTRIEGTGSGFVWDQKGHIVTNYHVVAKFATDTSGLRRCKVFLEDLNGNRFARDGKLVGYDPGYDLAVLKVDVEGDKLRPAIIGTSHGLRVGQSCFAIGNPYGYEHTLTTGVVSGLGREIPSPDGRKIRGAIQTDAAINSGNSGGPLIDSYGHVIGVNTATFTRKGTGISSGVNFAIPIDIVVQTIPSLIVYGTSVTNRLVSTAWVAKVSNILDDKPVTSLFSYMRGQDLEIPPSIINSLLI